jgi:hypothetical protein
VAAVTRRSLLQEPELGSVELTANRIPPFDRDAELSSDTWSRYARALARIADLYSLGDPSGFPEPVASRLAWGAGAIDDPVRAASEGRITELAVRLEEVADEAERLLSVS